MPWLPEFYYQILMRLYLKSNEDILRKTKYKTLEGEYVESVDPGTVRDCREFIKRYDGVENALKMARNESKERYISPLKNLNEGITM